MVLGYTVLYPQMGGDKPSGEHMRAYHLPNDTSRVFLKGNAPRLWAGFVILTLVSSTEEHEVVTKRIAGEIAEHFEIGEEIGTAPVVVRVQNHTVKQGREEDERWETPIWIEYRGYF